MRTELKTIGYVVALILFAWAIAGILAANYLPDPSFLNKMLAFPEVLPFLILGIRVCLLLVETGRTQRIFTMRIVLLGRFSRSMHLPPPLTGDYPHIERSELQNIEVKAYPILMGTRTFGLLA